MSKRVTLEDDELELIIVWLKAIRMPNDLSTHHWTKRWSSIAVDRLLKKLGANDDQPSV